MGIVATLGMLIAGASPPAPAAALPLQALTMVTPRVGWAFDRSTRQVMRTTDGGQVWTPVGPPHPRVHIALLSFPSTTHAVVIGIPSHLRHVGWRVWTTTTAGRIWCTSFLPEPTPHRYRQEGLLGPAGAQTLTWLTPTDGSLVTTLQGGFASADGDLLYHTTDGGRTWRFVTALPGLDDQGVVFSSPSIGWMAWGGNYARAPVLDESTDGGITWHAVALPRPPLVPAARNPRVGYNPQAVGLPRFATPQMGAVLTVYRGLSLNAQRILPDFFVVYVTTDGGRHWQWMVVARTPQPVNMLREAFMTPTTLRWRRSGSTWLLVVLNRYRDVVAEWPVSD